MESPPDLLRKRVDFLFDWQKEAVSDINEIDVDIERLQTGMAAMNLRLDAISELIRRDGMMERAKPYGPCAAYHDAELTQFEEQWCVRLPDGEEVRGISEQAARLIARAINAYRVAVQTEVLSRGDLDYFSANMGGQGGEE